jgi:NAD(P)-dependent dehydrogenase (short-subunit alcohol dehydrogenase family)
MKVADKIVVVTGGGSGIGKSLAERFAKDGAKKVVVADLNGEAAEAVAASIDGHGVRVDVSKEAEIQKLIDAVESDFGPIDLFCSNAGILHRGGLETPDKDWELMMKVNVWSHLYAARYLVPRMAKRGGGYFLNTASAAGLLTQIGSVTYSVTKHAAVSLAEWIAITHGHQGIKVSVICPQAVRTGMTAGGQGGVAGLDGMLEPDFVADVVTEALDEERFMILPHKEVAKYFQNKANDYDRWLNGMRRLQDRFIPKS